MPLPFDASLTTHDSLILIAALLWTLPWKGVALWRAARAKDTRWFVALLIINTVGILDIAYIFYFGKPRRTSKISSHDEI